MAILKNGTCFTAELELNCPTIVGCVTALPVGNAAVAGTTQVLGKDGQYHTLPAAPVAGPAQDPYATPAQTLAGTATALIVNPADLVARENISAQTGLSNNASAIPAPAANQSPWGQNLLGETLHYAPGLGWKIVDGRYGQVQSGTLPSSGDTIYTLTMPRAGIISASAFMSTSTMQSGVDGDVFVHINPGNTLASLVAADRYATDVGGSVNQANLRVSASADRIPVVAGQVITFYIRNNTLDPLNSVYRIAYSYTN